MQPQEKQPVAPPIDYPEFKNLFKEFDPKEFKSEELDKLMDNMKHKLHDFEVTGIERHRMHPSDSITKAITSLSGHASPHSQQHPHTEH